MTEDEIMTADDNTHTKPVGVFVTLREIHQTVLGIDKKLDSEVDKLKAEISSIKAQLAAQWVVHGILLATIIYLIQKGIA